MDKVTTVFTAFTQDELKAHDDEIRIQRRNTDDLRAKAVELAISAGFPATEVVYGAQLIEAYIKGNGHG